jgi:UDP-N-acetylmuramate dehydrogenase
MALKGIYKTDYNISHLTWFKTGGTAEYFFKPASLEDLSGFLHAFPPDKNVSVIGAGSNIIVRDGGIRGVLIKLSSSFCDIDIISEFELEVGAGCLNYNLAKFCLSQEIRGFEFLVGIPGTVGGGVVMNAGSYGKEFKDVISWIEVINRKGEISRISVNNIDFGYRKSGLSEEFIVLKAGLVYSKGEAREIRTRMESINHQRRLSQPIGFRTGGSTFANPPGMKAWELIDRSGLRGYRVGGAYMSDLHCNFMINDGSASSADLESLGEYVIESVYKNTGVKLEWEIKRIGFTKTEIGNETI